MNAGTMKFEIVDIAAVKKDLGTKIEHFENFITKSDRLDLDVRTILKDMLGLLRVYKEIIFKIKNQNDSNINFGIEKNTKVLSISEISSSFLNNLQLLAMKLHLPINEVLNALMENYSIDDILSHKNNTLIPNSYASIKKRFLPYKKGVLLSNKDFLEVLPSDVVDEKIQYNFKNIKILIFKNITEKDFETKIGMIEECDTIFISKLIPKLLIYAKTRNVITIKTYTSLNDVYDAILIFN